MTRPFRPIAVIADDDDDEQQIVCPRCHHSFSLRVALHAAWELWKAQHKTDR